MRYSIQDFIQLIAQLRNPNGGGGVVLGILNKIMTP